MNEQFALPAPVATYISGINAGSVRSVLAAFAADAMVNDEQKEFQGTDQIRPWLEGAMSVNVTLKPVALRRNGENIVVDAVIDGTFDKTDLPARIVLTHYFTLRFDLITQLIIILNDDNR